MMDHLIMEGLELDDQRKLLDNGSVLKRLRESEDIESVFVLIAMWIYNLLLMWIFPILKIRLNLLK